MSVPSLTPAHQTALDNFHTDFSKKVPWAILAAGSSTFLTSTALFIIFGSGLFIVFSTVPLLKIVLYGIGPGIILLCFSVPGFVATFILQVKMTKVRKDWMDKCEEIINDRQYFFYFLPKEKKTAFLQNLLKSDWKKDYKERIFSDLKDRLPKEKQRNETQKVLAKALDDAKKEIHKEPKKKKTSKNPKKATPTSVK
jgi:hypothetical protein